MSFPCHGVVQVGKTSQAFLLRATIVCISIFGLHSALVAGIQSNSQDAVNTGSSLAKSLGEDASNSKGDGGDSWLVSSSNEEKRAQGKSILDVNADAYAYEDVRSHNVSKKALVFMESKNRNLERS
jgi:hypothetical protein